jgi:oxygen-independent coproporphyrinogen-3 oxidase
VRGLYVHFPFCVRKCIYCDFYSLAHRQDLIGPYIDAVLIEARAYAGLSFDTLYFGGGTPSLLGGGGLKRLLDGLRGSFDLSRLVEATIEVNPESATTELLQAALGAGLNRVSVGVQSLSDDELQGVGRIHSAAQAVEAIAQANKVGFANVSADVIVGLPGQRCETLRATLGELVELGVNHLSVYCLSLEHDTPLAMNPPDDLPLDDEQAELFERACAFLQEKGFTHYEISNLALGGFECLHNLNYWRGGEYLGLGPAAASHLDGRRFKDRGDLEAYLQNPVELVEGVEQLNAKEKVAEEAILRLRLLSEGLSADDLVARFGFENTRALIHRLDEMVADGLLTRNGSRYRLVSSRVLTSNPIFARVLGD